MSKYIRAKSNISREGFSKEMLEAALKDCEEDLKLDDREKVENAYGEDLVEFGISRDKKMLSLGFAFDKDEETLQVRGDFYNTGLREKEFLKNIQIEYSKNFTINRIENSLNNYSIESVDKIESGYEIVVNEANC